MNKKIIKGLVLAFLAVFTFAPSVYAFDDNNETPETATPIAINEKVTGVSELALDTTGKNESYDNDYYTFTVSKACWINVKLTIGYEGMNYKLTDTTGDIVYFDGSSLNGGSAAAPVEASAIAKVPAGTFILHIRPTWPNRSGSYTLVVSDNDIKFDKEVYGIALNANLKFTKAEMNWQQVDDADGYIVYKYDKKSKKYKQLKDTKKTSVTLKTPTKETTYKFKVAAYIKLANGKKSVGPKSDVYQVSTMPKKVGQPKITGIGYGRKLTVNGISCRIFTLKWKKVKGATGYYVYGKSETQDWHILDTVTTNKALLYGGLGFKYKLQVVPYRSKNGLVTTGTKSKIYTTPTIR